MSTNRNSWLIITCVLSICMGIIPFLPGLIYSPPWNNCGYFISHPGNFDDCVYVYHQSGVFSLYTNNVQEGHELQVRGKLIEDKRLPGVWSHSALIGKMTITNNLISSYPEMPEEKSKMRKIYNPFIVWRIMWLEITSG